MRESEIVTLVKLVNAAFPNAKPVPPEALPLWFEDLADLPAEHARTAFTTYRRSGKEFPPTCAELRRLVLELQEPTPRFEHAWVAIQQAVTRWGSYREPMAEAELRAVSMAWDLVIAMGGWSCICLAGPNEYTPTDPGVWRSQAEHAWRALVEQRRTDMAVADIPSALPRVREATARLTRGADGMLAPATRIGDVLALPAPTASPTEPPPRAASETTKPIQLRPEYRAEIEQAIREGREEKLPERWRPFVEQVRREMSA